MMNRASALLALLVLSFGLLGSRCEDVDLSEARVVCAFEGDEPTFESHGICSDGEFCNGIEWCDPTHPLRDSRNCVTTDPCDTLNLQKVLGDDDIIRRKCSEPEALDRGLPFRACRVPRDCDEDHCWDRDEGLVVDGDVLVMPVEQKGDVLDHVDGFRYDIGCLRAVCTRDICTKRCFDDRVFCNGPEGCVSLIGCRRPENPCDEESPPPGAEFGFYECNEEQNRCDWICDDDDGDGESDQGCGGDDCDDGDPNRFPFNPETCDEAGRDEDCDPLTPGNQDADGDGYVSADCFNVVDGEETSRGMDCDDGDPSVNPAQNEVCNGVDDDCDGDVDEDLSREMFIDDDGDGFGEPGSGSLRCPSAGYSFIAGDCDDANPHMFPGAIYCNDPGNQQIPSYQLCQANGTFGQGACPSVCIEQPSGVGVCL